MRPVATDGVAWSICVCLLVTFVSPAQTAEPIEMSFGWMTRVGPRNHVLDESREREIPPQEQAIFRGCPQ